MGNLKEIRNRITSVKSTQQITRAMKMVSAAKLKKATDAIVRIRPYSYKLKEVIETLADSIDDLGEKSLVVGQEVAGALHAHDVADVAVEAAAMQSQRILALIAAKVLKAALGEGQCFVIHPHAAFRNAFGAPLQARLEMLLP